MNKIIIEGVEILLTDEQVEKLKKDLNINQKPKWEDLKDIKGFAVNTEGVVVECILNSSKYQSKFIYPSKEESLASLALVQLLYWRDKYNEGWKPDYNNISEKKYVIAYYGSSIQLDIYNQTTRVLAFKSTAIRAKFLSDFKDLIEIAKPLL